MANKVYRTKDHISFESNYSLTLKSIFLFLSKFANILKSLRCKNLIKVSECNFLLVYSSKVDKGNQIGYLLCNPLSKFSSYYFLQVIKIFCLLNDKINVIL